MPLDEDRLRRIRAAIVGVSPEEEDAHFLGVIAEIERAEAASEAYEKLQKKPDDQEDK